MLRRIGLLGSGATTPGCKKKFQKIIRPSSRRTFIENRLVAGVGSRFSGGAVAIQGSRRTFIENRPVHRMGDRNSCGGSLRTNMSQRTFCG